MIAPDFYGCTSRGQWHGKRPFALKDEAALVVEIIDRCSAPVHLVGHSYGGGVALRVGVERPTQIASMALYEPTAFNILKVMEPDGASHLAEIRAVAHDLQRSVLNGAYQAAALWRFASRKPAGALNESGGYLGPSGSSSCIAWDSLRVRFETHKGPNFIGSLERPNPLKSGV